MERKMARAMVMTPRRQASPPDGALCRLRILTLSLGRVWRLWYEENVSKLALEINKSQWFGERIRDHISCTAWSDCDGTVGDQIADVA